EEVQPALVHAEAAIADQVPTLVDPGVTPQLRPGARLHRVDVVGNRKIKNPVDQQRGGFDDRDRRAALRLDLGNGVLPLQLQRRHVRLVDLPQRTEALTRVIAVERRPLRGGRLTQQRHVQLVGRGRRREQRAEAEYLPQVHLRLSRYAVTLIMSESARLPTITTCGASGSCSSTATVGSRATTTC